MLRLVFLKSLLIVAIEIFSPFFLQIKSIGKSVLTCAGQISVQQIDVVFGQCGNSINFSDPMPGTKLGLDVFFWSTIGSRCRIPI